MDKSLATKSNVLKKRMLIALEKNLGNVTAAAKKAKIDRASHYRWLEKSETYRKEVETIVEVALDFAEGKLMSNIRKGDTTATIFYLKTKGKGRGYIERTEVDNRHLIAQQPTIMDWESEIIDEIPNDTIDNGTPAEVRPD